MIKPFGQDLIDEAQRIKAQQRERLEALDNDPRIADTYRAEQKAETRTDTQDRLNELSRRFDESVATELDRLRRKLSAPTVVGFGAEKVAADASFRDAMERARSTSAADPAELMQLYTDAHNVSDVLQQRAAMVVAIDRRHIDVLNAWVNDYPETEADVQRLLDLTEQAGGLGASIAAAFYFAAE